MRAGVFVLIVALLVTSSAGAASLKEMYDLALPGSGYDKDIVLETGVTYTGGLLLGGTFNRITAEFEQDPEDVRIVGNGAILDVQGSEICVAYSTSHLDIQDCVILNGNVRFLGYNGGGMGLLPTGSVRYVTFYRPHDYGVRLYACGTGIEVERNIVVGPVDTGPDHQYVTGVAMPWLPTGVSFALSVTGGGIEVFDNWSYHLDPEANADAMRHFSLMCDYG